MDILVLVLLGIWFRKERKIKEKEKEGFIKKLNFILKFYLIFGIGLILFVIFIVFIY